MDLLEEISNAGFAAQKLADLARASRDRKALEFRNYADLLYDIIINQIHPNKDNTLEALESSVREGHKTGVLLWSYTVTHHAGLSPDTMAELSEVGNHTVIFDDEIPMSVDRIIQNSDILWRIAFTFGINFRVHRRQGQLRVYGADRQCYEMELWLEFVDYLNDRDMKSLLDAYKGVMNRPLYQGKAVRMSPTF